MSESDSTRAYNVATRANLPLGLTYSETLGRYVTNKHRSFSFEDAKQYQDYISKYNYTTDFVMTVDIDVLGDFTIPCSDDGVFNAVIDWGDDTTSTITAFNDPALLHIYAAEGTYKISISGSFPNIRFTNTGDRSKVISVDNLGIVGWVSLKNAFYGCNNLVSFVSGATDTSNVSLMDNLFRNCDGIVYLDVSTLDTSSVTTFNNSFRGLSQMTVIDLTGFDTSNVSTFTRMFRDCTSLTDVINIEWFNIEAIDGTGNLDDLFLNSGINTSRYDQVLVNWDQQDPIQSLSPNFGYSQYTAGSAAETARDSLTNNDLWLITDGGPA